MPGTPSTGPGNRRDLPFTLTYLFGEDGAIARLAGSTGIAAGHPAAPAGLAAGDPDPVWPIAALLRGESALVSLVSARFAGLPAGAWSEPPVQALIAPLAQQGGAPYGFLVAGLNRYRPLDEGYRGFVGLVAGHLAAGIASARSYQDQQRRAEELAELDRAKTTFFSNISHEFRTPLTLIMGPVQELQRRLADADPQVREELEVISRNGLRLGRLVNTLLDFSRIEAGRMQASYEPVDIAQVTAELASVFRSAVDRAGLAFEVDCRPPPEPVYLDRGMWEKVVLNLLSNALKFRTLIDSLQEGFFVTDSEGTILEANQAFLALVGYSPDGLPFRWPHPWVPDPGADPDGWAVTAQAFTDYQRHGGGRYTVQVRHRDGRAVWLACSSASLPSPDGRGQLFVGTARDVTAERLAGQREATLAGFAAALAAAGEISEMLTTAAREIAAAVHASQVTTALWSSDDNPAITGWPRPTPGQGASAAMTGALDAIRHQPAASVTVLPGDEGTSLLAAPLDGTGSSAIAAESPAGRPVSAEVRELFSVLTSHLAQVLAKARDYEQTRAVALTLQHAILAPTELPHGFAARYTPAVPPLEVGGDWDTGSWRSSPADREQPAPGTRGHGVIFMHALMDHVTIDPSAHGTTVTLTKDLKPWLTTPAQPAPLTTVPRAAAPPPAARRHGSRSCPPANVNPPSCAPPATSI